MFARHAWCFGVLLLAQTLLVQALPALGEEPVTLENPSFEDGLDGWHWWFSPPDSVELGVVPHGEEQALQMLGTSGGRVAFYQNVAARPQTWYRIRFRYRAVPREGGGIFGYTTTRMIDPNGKHFAYLGQMALLDTFGKWREGERYLQTPLSCDSFWLEFNSEGACDLRIDDVSVSIVDPPSHAPAQNTWDELTVPREDRPWYSSWQYILRPEPYRQMAMKYGWQYIWEEQFDLLAETHTTTWALDEPGYPLLAEHRIPTCDYPYYRAKEIFAALPEEQRPRDLPNVLNPAWHDSLVEACRQLIDEHAESPGIAYVFAGDEILGHCLKSVTPVAERESARWDEIDREVREQFGGGRHGLPDGPDDANPYRWIAYVGWVRAQYMATMRRFRAEIERSGCGAELLGPDEAGSVYPWPWADLGEVVDVCTGQSLPSQRSAHAWNTGYVTKCYRDMTGRPVHNATQIVMYGGSPSPQEVQRRYSQVLQNGGEGEMLIAEEWGDRELGHHEYSAPARWETVKNMLRLMQTHRVLTPNTSRVGVLYSNPSMMAMGPRLDDTAIETGYAFCGPILGAWPRMIDSYGLARGAQSLEGLSLLVVPWAPIETAEVLRQVREFAEAGGLVVCCHPNAFERGPLGDPLDGGALLGTRAWRMSPQRSIDALWPTGGRQRVFADDCFALQPARPDARVVGRYPDGTPAAVMHRVGDGRVLVFGATPLGVTDAADDSDWATWWRAVLAAADVPMDLPIWRLRLPDEAVVTASAPDDVCVTGNSYVRCQNGVYLGTNDPMEGTYAMSVSPDLSPESAGPGAVAFSDGDLTDRAKADLGPFGSGRRSEEPYREADWADRWSGETLASGLQIDFTLPSPRALTRLRLWYSGTRPELAIQVGGEGRWQAVERLEVDAIGPDVKQVTVPLAGEHAQVRLNFGPSDEAFAIADVELWARASD